MPPPPVESPAPSLWLTTLQTFLIGFAAALATGLLILAAISLVGSQTSCPQNDDGWCFVGWFLIGLVVGGAIAIAAYIIGGVLFIHAKVPSGSRGTYVVLHLMAPVAVSIVLGVIAALAEAAGG